MVTFINKGGRKVDQYPIFVYGTLRKDGCRDIFRSFSRTVEQAMLENATLYDLGTFPCIKLEGNSCVKGELHNYTDRHQYQEVLKQMDRIEGYNGLSTDLFTREIVKVTLPSGKQVKAYVYVYNGEVKEKWIIPSGEWLQEKSFLRRIRNLVKRSIEEARDG